MRLLLALLLATGLLTAPAHAAERSDKAVLQEVMEKINFNWAVPLTVWKGQRVVTLCINLGPKGELVSSQICQSSGDAKYDASLQQALRKSFPLPIPESKLPHFQQLKLTFTRRQ